MEWLGDFTPTEHSPSPRKGHTFTNLLGTPIILLFAGEDEGGVLLDDMYALHIERREWQRVIYAPGPKPTPRLLHTAVSVSSTSLVVIGGDTWDAAKLMESGELDATAMNDIWVFDYSDKSWQEITDTGSIKLPHLSCSSAVFGRSRSQVPGVYIFGGYKLEKTNQNVVYRLRISDWKLETLPHVEVDENGKKTIVRSNDTEDSNEAQATKQTEGSGKAEKFGKRIIPKDRESHGAIWLPGVGMLIIGGDGGQSILGDCWLFSQHKDDLQSWRWQELRLVPTGNRVGNRLPPLAGHSLTVLPTSSLKVMVWGGILNTGQEVMASNISYVIDLDKANLAQTIRVTNTGRVPKAGRILHGFVRARDMVFAFGGCDSEGKSHGGVPYGRLLPNFKALNQAASYFGSEAATMAKYGGRVEKSDFDGDKLGNGVTRKSSSANASRTALTGKILEVMDIGLLVSIEIDGKSFKGVLVANETDDETMMIDIPDVIQNASKGSAGIRGDDMPSKRPKLDAAAAALPDSPPKVRSNRNKVIHLE
ncbi:unnamed protein product [Agarophyton chilense]|eukprot:gb/GEZJ01001451.1/.p1 GENE.gb/GEZJ01001451.1/~~gb/GEZJ01001451.1/.p1  ORF type:complete len:535 (+),score=71.15 gb/GEZJ01001451.1/:709-2313(+)